MHGNLSEHPRWPVAECPTAQSGPTEVDAVLSGLSIYLGRSTAYRRTWTRADNRYLRFISDSPRLTVRKAALSIGPFASLCCLFCRRLRWWCGFLEDGRCRRFRRYFQPLRPRSSQSDSPNATSLPPPGLAMWGYGDRGDSPAVGPPRSAVCHGDRDSGGDGKTRHRRARSRARCRPGR